MRIAVLLLMMTCLVVAMPIGSHAVGPGGVIISGQAQTSTHGYPVWRPIFPHGAMHVEQDPLDLLYGEPVLDPSSQVELGIRRYASVSSSPPLHSYEGFGLAFLGTTVSAFDFEYYAADGIPWTTSSGLSLQLWGGYIGKPATLRWVSNGPWGTEHQHVYLTVSEWWHYEFRLAIEYRPPVPEPGTLVIFLSAMTTSFLCFRQRRHSPFVSARVESTNEQESTLLRQ